MTESNRNEQIKGESKMAGKKRNDNTHYSELEKSDMLMIVGLCQGDADKLAKFLDGFPFVYLKQIGKTILVMSKGKK